MPNHFLNTELFDKAAHFAISAHANTERRAKGFPYIIHPMEAAAIVATMTTDPELLAAAILHDTLEHTEVTFEELRSQFGNRVAYLVLAESNIKTNVFGKPRAEGKSRSVCSMPRRENDGCEETNVFDKPRAEGKSRSVCTMPRRENVCCEEMNGILRQTTWRESKSRAVERLANASHEGKIVAMGDKLSNLRAIASDYQLIGDQLWSRFHAPEGKKDVEWYYRALFDALNDLKGTLPYQEFERLIRQTWGEKKE